MRPALLALLAILLVVALRRREPDRAVMQPIIIGPDHVHHWTRDFDIDVCFQCGATRDAHLRRDPDPDLCYPGCPHQDERRAARRLVPGEPAAMSALPPQGHAHLWICMNTLPCELGTPHRCQELPEIREDPEADGSLDDLVVDGGIRMFHIERMGTGHWWFAVYLTDGTRLSFNLHSGRKISARYDREDVG